MFFICKVTYSFNYLDGHQDIQLESVCAGLVISQMFSMFIISVISFITLHCYVSQLFTALPLHVLDFPSCKLVSSCFVSLGFNTHSSVGHLYRWLCYVCDNTAHVQMLMSV